MLSSALLAAAHWASHNERAAGKEVATRSRAQIESRDRMNGKALMRLLIAEDDKALGLFLRNLCAGA